MDVLKLVRLARKRRFLIGGLMLAALLAATVAHIVAQSQAQYVATATVLPSPRAMQPGGLVPNGKGETQAPTYDRYSRLALFVTRLQNQQDDALDLCQQPPLEQKRVIARALVNQISSQQGRALAVSPDSTETQLDSVLSAFRVPTTPDVWTPRAVTPTLREQIRDGLQAAPVYNDTVNQTPGGSSPTPTTTDFIAVRVSAPSPAAAQQIATLLAAVFINGYADTSRLEYGGAVTRASDAQRTASHSVAAAQNALTAFQKSSRFVDIKAQGTSAVSDLEALRQQQSKARVDAVGATQAAEHYEQAAEAATPQNRVELDPAARPEVQALSLQIGQDETALQTLRDRATDENPRVQQTMLALSHKKAQLADLLRQPYIVAQPNPQYAQLTTQAAQAKAQAAQAQGALSTLNTQIAALEQASVTTLPDAQKRMAALQDAYDTALANKKAADESLRELVAASRQSDNGFVALSRPATYALPESAGPSLPALLVYAAVLSFALGMGLSLFLESLDKRIQTPQDASRLLGMPVTAVIPALPPGGTAKQQARITLSDPLSPFAESYRLLRTDLMLAAAERPFQSVMCATAKPGQGATTTLCNLAIALAQAGKRVILIDADLRRPKLHAFFGTANDTGLVSLLRGECEMEEALKQTEIDNLLLLPSGPIPENPSELLASQKMRTLHDRLKPHTDFVLLDTPSAIAFSDSAILASIVDGVMVVIRAQEAPRGGERGVQEMLTRARARIVGVVLNGAQPELVDSYYYHAAYYPPLLETENAPRILPAPMRDGYEPTLMGVTLPPQPNGRGAGVKDVPVGNEQSGGAQKINGSKKGRGINWRALLGPDDPEE